MKSIKLTGSNSDLVIEETLSVLKNDGLVVFPTDTVYGLLADAQSEKAVSKLLQFKNRQIGKPISVFTGNIKLTQQQLRITNYQLLIINNLLPGPYTIVLPSKHKVDCRLESEKGTLGFRIPDYPLVNNLVVKYGSPLTATSANLSGTPPHYLIKTFLNSLPKDKKKLIDLIVDAGTLPPNQPSTVIDYSGAQAQIIRQGDIIPGEIIISNSSDKTKEIAFNLAKKYCISSDKPVIFLVDGEMGSGKTVFVKGLASYFGINNIISPTFVIYYEYKILIKQKSRFCHSTAPSSARLNQQFQSTRSCALDGEPRFVTPTFLHFDLYRIEDKHELKDLNIDKIITKNNIIAIEWPKIALELLQQYKSKATIVNVKIEYLGRSKRKIKINLKY